MLQKAKVASQESQKDLIRSSLRYDQTGQTIVIQIVFMLTQILVYGLSVAG